MYVWSIKSGKIHFPRFFVVVYNTTSTSRDCTKFLCTFIKKIVLWLHIVRSIPHKIISVYSYTRQLYVYVLYTVLIWVYRWRSMEYSNRRKRNLHKCVSYSHTYVQYSTCYSDEIHILKVFHFIYYVWLVLYVRDMFFPQMIIMILGM